LRENYIDSKTERENIETGSKREKERQLKRYRQKERKRESVRKRERERKERQ
jgi:hypothetical protein